MNRDPSTTLYKKYEHESKNIKSVSSENTGTGFFKKPQQREEGTDPIKYLYTMFADLRKGREEIKNDRSNL